MEIVLDREDPGNPVGVDQDSGLGTSEGKNLSHGFAPQSDPVEVTPAAAYPLWSHSVLASDFPLCPPAISEIPREDS